MPPLWLSCGNPRPGRYGGGGQCLKAAAMGGSCRAPEGLRSLTRSLCRHLLPGAASSVLECAQKSRDGWEPRALGEGDTHTGASREWAVTATPGSECLGCARRRQHKEIIFLSLALCWGSSNALKKSVACGKMQRKAQDYLHSLPCPL